MNWGVSAGDKLRGGDVDAQVQPFEQVEESHVYHLGPYVADV